MEKQVPSHWHPTAPRIRPFDPASRHPQPRLPSRVLARSILIATLIAFAVKLVPVEWGHVLTGLVITGSNLPL